MKPAPPRPTAHRETFEKLMGLADRDLLAPCYLFVGPKGIGKTSLCLQVIQALLCENRKGADARGLTSEACGLTSEACGFCGSCLRMQKREHESVFLVEPENSTRSMIKVEQAQGIRRFLQLRALRSRRFVMIEEADRMNAAAANSLLKTLEEPDSQTTFFMTAVGSRHLLPTLRSRSQMLRLRPLTIPELKGPVAASDWALRLSRGSASELKSLTQVDALESRTAAKNLFLGWLEERRAPFSLLRDFGRDRNRAIAVAYHFNLILRDWLAFLLDPQQVLGTDLLKDFKALRPQPLEVVARIGWKATRLQTDILANRDVALLFEEFFILASRELVLS